MRGEMKTLFTAGLIALIAAPALAQNAGETQYVATCSACHQANGQGIKGAFPALVGDYFVLADPNDVIATVLNGRGGMPAWKTDLTDAQIAATITYIRSAWGNSAPPVTADMVAADRAKAGATAARSLQAH